jgi:O-antigen/teichoic acid export membrane protein
MSEVNKFYFKKKYNLFIKKYSKKFGLDLKYFLNGGFWVSIFQSTNLIRAFILSVLFANLVEPEFFGQYNFITSILSFLLIFSIPSINSALIQTFSINKDYTYFKGLKLVFKYSLIGSTILFLISIYYYYSNQIDLSIITIILGIIFPLYSCSPYYQTYYLGKKKFKEYALINSSSLILTLISIIIMLILNKKLIFILIIPILIKIIFESYFTFIHIKSKIKNKNIDKENIIHAKKTYISHIFYVGSYTIEPILIGVFLGVKELAIYTIITLIPNQSKTLFNFITPTFLPKLSEQAHKITKKEILKHLIKLELIFLFIYIGYSISASLIFDILYSQYSTYTHLSIIFGVTMLTVPQLFIIYYFKVKLDTININRINIFAIISSIIIVYPSIIFLTFEYIIYSKILQTTSLMLFSMYILLK